MDKHYLNIAKEMIKASGLTRAEMQDEWELFLEECEDRSPLTAIDSLSQSLKDRKAQQERGE